jgi:lipoate-protein ligase A
MIAALRANFEGLLGPLTPAKLPGVVRQQVAELARTHTTEEWLLKPSKPSLGRKVKIAEGVEVVQRTHKAPGGLIRGTVEIQRGQIVAVGLSGDFFFYPASKLSELEAHLTGLRLSEVPEAIVAFYREHDIDSPGVAAQDLALALGVTQSGV